MDDIIATVREYGSIIFGLVIGAIAHFGTRMANEDTMTWKQVLGFAMQLGIIGLVASVSTRELGS